MNASGRLENITYSERQKGKGIFLKSISPVSYKFILWGAPYPSPCSSASSPKGWLSHALLNCQIPTCTSCGHCDLRSRLSWVQLQKSPEQELAATLRVEAWGCPMGWFPSLLWAELCLLGHKLWEEKDESVPHCSLQEASWEAGAALAAWQPVQMPSCQAQTDSRQLPQIEGWMSNQKLLLRSSRSLLNVNTGQKQEENGCTEWREEKEPHVAGRADSVWH